MPKVSSHRDLIVWNKAMDLAVDVYRLTASFPAAERYRLVDQLSRAAASVPANIAEGHARSTARDFAHFLSIARGSLMETQTYIMLAIRLGYLTDSDAAAALDHHRDQQDAHRPPEEPESPTVASVHSTVPGPPSTVPCPLSPVPCPLITFPLRTPKLSIKLLDSLMSR